MKLIGKFLFLSLIIFITSCSPSNNDINNLNLFFFDVNQGDSSLINYKDVSILIDTGESEFTDSIIDIIKSKGIKTLDYVILSHDHSDHVSGFEKIFKNFKIKNLILPDVFRNDTFLSIKSLIKNSNIKTIFINKPTILKLKDDFKLKFISTIPTNPKEFNDSSLVFQAQIKDFDILYTGDIEEERQLKLIGKNIESEILKVPHHGAYNNDLNNVEKFIKTVNPKISVISVGTNSYGHPNKNTLKILENEQSKILRTDELGNIIITCDFKNNSLKINSFI